MAKDVSEVRVAPEEPAALQVEVVDRGGRPVAPPPEPAAAPRVARVEPASVPPPSPPSRGTAAVQLGAFRDEAAAKAAWARFSTDPALKGLRPRFEPVERPGVSLVRLKAGPLASADQAKAVCARLGVTDAWCAKGEL